MQLGNQVYSKGKHLELLNHRVTLKYSKYTLEYESLFLLWAMSSLSVELLKEKKWKFLMRKVYWHKYKPELMTSLAAFFCPIFSLIVIFPLYSHHRTHFLGFQLLRSVIIISGAINYIWGICSHAYSGLSCLKLWSCC